MFDSDPYDEYIETMNKLGANIATLTKAEKFYTRLQNSEKSSKPATSIDLEAASSRPAKGAHIDLAVG